MEETNEVFEKNAMKYLETPSEEKPEEVNSKPEAEPETPQEPTPTVEEEQADKQAEQEAMIKQFADDAQKKIKEMQNPQLHLSPEAEALRKQHEEFINGLDMEKEMAKLRNAVTPESDKVFFAWLHMRFPGLFEEVEREHQEQLAREMQMRKQMEEELKKLEEQED